MNLRRFFCQWMWQLPAYMGFGFPLGGDYTWITEEQTTWPGSQVVLATVDGEFLILDCLVPAESGGGTRVPITLRTRSLSASSPDFTDDDLVSGWAAGGTLVDIALDERGNEPRVRISHGTELVDLALESAA